MPPTDFTEFTELLSGGAAVSAAPTEQSYLPTDFTEFTELLSGGAAVPAAPTKHSCTNINYPTEFTEFTETSGREELPTDFTDAHRSLGCVFAS